MSAGGPSTVEHTVQVGPHVSLWGALLNAGLPVASEVYAGVAQASLFEYIQIVLMFNAMIFGTAIVSALGHAK